MRRAIMALAAALLAAAPGATAAAESVTLRYGQIPSTVRSVSSLYTFIARQKGFLAREYIKLEHVIPFMGEGGVLKPPLPRPSDWSI